MSEANLEKGINSDDLAPSRLVIVLPVIHLVLSTIFMWGYCKGFGGRLESFTDIGDIFTFSIGGMIFVYAVTFGIPAAIIAFQYGTNSRFPSLRLNSLDPGPSRDKLAAQIEKANFKSSMLSLVMMLALAGYTAWEYVNYNTVFYLGPAFIATLIINNNMPAIKRSLKLNNITYEVLGFMLTLPIYSAAIGLQIGQNDRNRAFSDLTGSYFSCNGGAVLRQIGDTLLVIKPDNSKALINLECKELFVVDRPAKAPQAAPLPKPPAKVPQAAAEGQGKALARP